MQLQAPLAALMQPLSRLPALQHLTLSELGLTGSLPPEWAAALPALQLGAGERVVAGMASAVNVKHSSRGQDGQRMLY